MTTIQNFLTVDKLQSCGPAEYNKWRSVVNDLLGLAPDDWADAKKSRAIRLTLLSVLHDVLKGIPQADVNNPDAILQYLEDKAKPNIAHEQFGVFKEIFSFKQTSEQSVHDFFVAWEMLKSKAVLVNLALPDSLWAFLLQNGLMDPIHQSIVVSKGTADVAEIKQAVCGLHKPIKIEEEVFVGFSRKPGVCQRCNKAGHSKRNCPLNVCWKCKKNGHISPDCPDNRQTSEVVGACWQEAGVDTGEFDDFVGNSRGKHPDMKHLGHLNHF